MRAGTPEQPRAAAPGAVCPTIFFAPSVAPPAERLEGTHARPSPARRGRHTVRPQPVREAWSTGAEVAGAPWQTRRSPPSPSPLLLSPRQPLPRRRAPPQGRLCGRSSARSERRRFAALVAVLAGAPVSVARPRPRPKETTAPGKPAPCVSRASPDPGHRQSTRRTVRPPARKRREMSAAEKKAVSERMTAYWTERRKKAAKK